jgi:pyruvate dehydrogenase E2 component (dihydrolipoamide acetyltransferase)
MAHGKVSANPNDFILPDLGEGVHEAELIKWRVEVGQTVAEHDILAEMETDKALVEVPSPRAGTIAVLHGEPGEILRVGNPLVSYVGEGTEARRHEGTKGKGAQPVADAHANGSAHAEAEREDAGTVVGALSEMKGVTAAPGKVLATPAVRRMARDMGVDINACAGTGIGGRVTDKDIRAAASGATLAKGAGRSADRTGRAGKPGSPASIAPFDTEEPHSEIADAPVSVVVPQRRVAPTAVSGGGDVLRGAIGVPARAAARVAGPADGPEATRIPFRGVRRTIANRLRESVNQAVHFNVMDEADVSALDILRKRLAAASGEKISFLPFVASAVCRVLSDPEFRAMNSTVDDPAEEIIQHRAVHVGIATDTESGLMVPVIRDCDGLGVLEIGRQISAIAGAARSRSIPREQLVGSTFTISNVGSHAGRFATPIINYPEVGILAVGRGRQAPVVRQTPAGPAFAIGNMLPLSLACDHRVVDGATAALGLARIIELLQSPEQLMGPARG